MEIVEETGSKWVLQRGRVEGGRRPHADGDGIMRSDLPALR